QAVTSDLVQKVQSVLNSINDKTKDPDGTVKTGIASALGLDPSQVRVSHPGGDSNVEIELDLHKDLANATLPTNFNLNLGLPGLPVNIGASTKGSIQAQLGYDLALAFGYNGTFFVDGNAKLSDFGDSLPAHQFALHALVQPSVDFSASATVGILQASLTNITTKDDHTNPVSASKLDGTFNVDGVGISGTSLTGTPKVTLTGAADVNL